MSEASRRKTGPWILPPPWLPSEYELADATAIQAVTKGEADANQQIRAMKWIVEQACGTYDLGWHPTGDHESSFAAGKRFVGTSIVKLSRLNTGVLEQAQRGTHG